MNGAVSGFRTFLNAFGTGNPCYYVIVDGTAWETGIGIVTSGGPNTLSRDTVLDSSAAGAKLSLSAGAKTVFNDIPADVSINAIANVENPIINGLFNVWQNGTTFPAVANDAYTADCWAWSTVGAGVVTISRSTNVPTVAQAGVLLNYSLEVDVTTADAALAASDLYAFYTRIEGYNWRHFAQRPFIVSFWVRDTKTGVHAISFANSNADRTYLATYTINVADTWEYKTVAVSASPSAGTWDYTNGIGLSIRFNLGAGSNFDGTGTENTWTSSNHYSNASTVNSMDSATNFFRIVGVKLELSAATPVQFRPFQRELALCERYFQKSFLYDTAPAQSPGISTGEFIYTASVAGASSQYAPNVLFGARMRAAPTITTYNPAAANAQVRNLTDATDLSATTIYNNTETGFLVYATGTAGTAAGERLGVHWTAAAQL